MQRPLAIAAILGLLGFICIVLLLVFSPNDTPLYVKNNAANETEEQFISSRLSKLSEEDKVRQMFIWTVTGPNVPDEELARIAALKPGGVMISGSMNHTELLRLTVQLRSLKLPVPLIIAIDQEGGQVRRFSDDTLEDGREQSAISDTEFCEGIKQSSRWLSELGVNLNFGIIADIAWTPESVMYLRSYGSEPASVSKHVAEAVQCTHGVMTTVKHFPGHGRTPLDSHFSVPVIDVSYDEWKKTDAQPFKVAIQNNVDAVMMGHLSYSAVATEPASLSAKWVQEVRTLGFNGLIITDDMGMLDAAGIDSSVALKQAILAGNDMILYANSTAEPTDLVQEAKVMVEQKEIPVIELNEHVKRILRVKYRL